MPQRLQIVRTKDFLRLNARGEMDLERSRQALQAVAKICIDSGLDCVLLDLRDVGKHQHLSITDLWTLASEFRKMGFQPSHRLAVLHRLDAMERAEFFANCTANRGFRVEVFDSFEEAFEWISVSTPAEVRGGDGGGSADNPVK